jgi:hypothetical protein
MRINGEKVVDATKPLKLTITDRDVSLGNTKDPGACAAARACMRETHATAARVHVGRTYLKIGEKWVRFNTGAALRSEIVAFDRGGKFEPGEYKLSPPQPSHRASGKRQGTTPTRRTGKKRAKPHIMTGVRERSANR